MTCRRLIQNDYFLTFTQFNEMIPVTKSIRCRFIQSIAYQFYGFPTILGCFYSIILYPQIYPHGFLNYNYKLSGKQMNKKNSNVEEFSIKLRYKRFTLSYQFHKFVLHNSVSN